jgi:hypothetical protein
MNHDINKDGNSMSGNESTGTRRRRRVGIIGVVGVAGICATAAAMVPAPTTTQAIESGTDQGLVCEWGDINPTTSARDITLTATSGYTSEPDGNAIFDWSYTNPSVRSFQLPGPTLCANLGDVINVTLTNALPVATSIQFPGQTGVTYTRPDLTTGPVGPVADTNGDLTSLVQDAAPSTSITYSFTANSEGTFVYQSGTDPQLQVQMGLFGSIVIYPNVPVFPADIDAIPVDGGGTNGSAGFATSTHRDAIAAEAGCAYRSLDNPSTCDPLAIYEKDRENILVLSEVDPGVHSFIEQEQQNGNTGNLNWNAYPVGYEAHYFMINGRSMPDTIAPNFAPWLPAQPYGSLAVVEPWQPTVNPLDAFIRYVGIGTAGYDFHPHSNHEHVIAEDASLLKSATVPASDTAAAIPGIDATEEKFNILVGAGSTVDATFRWTNEEDYRDTSGHQTSVQWPQGANLMEGDFWSGSPYLGNSGLLNPGIIGKTQCGEYYHVAHNHDLTQVTNYGITFGGMLTLIKVEPLGTGLDTHSPCNKG